MGEVYLRRFYARINTMSVDRIEITGRFYREGERARLEELANRYGVSCARNTDQYGDIGLEGWWDPVKGRHPGLHLLNPTRVQFTADVLKRCNVSTDGQVLEGGSGGGIFAEALARRGYRVIGVEISKGAIRVARKHAEQSRLNNITYEQGSLYKLPFPDASFQAAVYPDVLEHLEDLDSAMKEISRVLVIGGVLVFDTISRNIPSARLYMELEQCGIIPAGTHDPLLFIRPSELKKVTRRYDLEMARDPNNPYGVDIQSVAVSQGGDERLSFELKGISRGSQIGHYVGYAIKN